jgi:hypothetical protein
VQTGLKTYNPLHHSCGKNRGHNNPFGGVALGSISVLAALMALILLGCRYDTVRNTGRIARELQSYSTKFPKTEPILSEGGIWVNGGAAGDNLWGNIQTMPGMAFGVIEPTKYGDPTAILKGEWDPDQKAQATVRVVDYARFKDISCHEVEVRLRTKISGAAHMITGYEVYGSLMANNPYLHIASWGGPNGVWVNMDSKSPAIYLKDGDILMGTVTGTNPVVITLYINGIQMLQVEDRGEYTFSDGKRYGPWSSGAPGIGFFDNVDEEWSAFGISAFSATGQKMP